jgi:hypothetical protein
LQQVRWIRVDFDFFLGEGVPEESVHYDDGEDDMDNEEGLVALVSEDSD